MADSKDITATERAISALVGYSCGAVVVLPFDRVKSLLQVSTSSRQMGALGLARNILATQGIRGLYKGAGPHMLIAPYTVLYYSMYDELLGRGRALTECSSSSGGNPCVGGGHPLVPLGAACVARTAETTVRMPFELLRTIMQTSKGDDVTLASCVRALLRQPPSSWFRGIAPTLMRDVPFSAIYWCGYEQAKGSLRLPPGVVRDDGVRHACESFLSGAAAGLFAAIVVAPLDVIKTVRQHRLESGAASSYAEIFATLRRAPALAFAGIGPRLIRIPAGLATMMAALEATKRAFELRTQRRRAEAAS